jgi:hypothetical protein
MGLDSKEAPVEKPVGAAFERLGFAALRGECVRERNSLSSIINRGVTSLEITR